MDITKASTGLINHSGPDSAPSNVIPFPSSRAQTQAQAALTYSSPSEDRFIPSSPGTEAADGVADTITLSSVSSPAPSARDARAAEVIASVQSGTYQVDPRAVATALISKMLTGSDSPASEP